MCIMYYEPVPTIYPSLIKHGLLENPPRIDLWFSHLKTFHLYGICHCIHCQVAEGDGTWKPPSFYGDFMGMEVVKGLNPSAWSMPPRNSLFWHWPYQRKLRKKRWRQWCDSLVCVKVYVQFEALEIGNGTSSRVSFVMGIDGTQRTLPIIVYTSINLVTIIGWY